MKIQINLNYLQSFRERNQPATVTISKTNIAFNNIAKKLLALEKGSGFEFEFEDGKLFYRDSTNDGFNITQVQSKMITCQLSGIGFYIAHILSSKETKFKFTLGEFKEGRREMIKL